VLSCACCRRSPRYCFFGRSPPSFSYPPTVDAYLLGVVALAPPPCPCSYICWALGMRFCVGDSQRWSRHVRGRSRPMGPPAQKRAYPQGPLARRLRVDIPQARTSRITSICPRQVAPSPACCVPGCVLLGTHRKSCSYGFVLDSLGRKGGRRAHEAVFGYSHAIHPDGRPACASTRLSNLRLKTTIREVDDRSERNPSVR